MRILDSSFVVLHEVKLVKKLLGLGNDFEPGQDLNNNSRKNALVEYYPESYREQIYCLKAWEAEASFGKKGSEKRNVSKKLLPSNLSTQS